MFLFIPHVDPEDKPELSLSLQLENFGFRNNNRLNSLAVKYNLLYKE